MTKNNHDNPTGDVPIDMTSKDARKGESFVRVGWFYLGLICIWVSWDWCCGVSVVDVYYVFAQCRVLLKISIYSSRGNAKTSCLLIRLRADVTSWQCARWFPFSSLEIFSVFVFNTSTRDTAALLSVYFVSRRRRYRINKRRWITKLTRACLIDLWRCLVSVLVFLVPSESMHIVTILSGSK